MKKNKLPLHCLQSHPPLLFCGTSSLHLQPSCGPAFISTSLNLKGNQCCLGYLLLFGIVNEVPQLKSPWTVLYRLPPNVLFVNKEYLMLVHFRTTAKVLLFALKSACLNLIFSLLKCPR
jgi:hypothetical protein